MRFWLALCSAKLIHHVESSDELGPSSAIKSHSAAMAIGPLKTGSSPMTSGLEMTVDDLGAAIPKYV